MTHEKLNKLNDWCNSTKVLHLAISFQNRTGDWAVRVCTNAFGKASPLRTVIGADLEQLCEEILPLAQEKFMREIVSITRNNQNYEKRQKFLLNCEARDIEALHQTSDDF